VRSGAAGTILLLPFLALAANFLYRFFQLLFIEIFFRR
jgi:hypothetical protein